MSVTKANTRWSFSSAILDGLDKGISAIAPPSKSRFLSGNYGPVGEAPAVEDNLEVTGQLPECLNGEYVRNGPNPRFNPRGGYHWFDGDGMLHGVRIKDGKASYVCRFVKTGKLQQEEAYAGPQFLKLGELVGKAGLAKVALSKMRSVSGVIDTKAGSRGTANTAMAYHAGQLMALVENDVPYVIRVLQDGDLQTQGANYYNGQLKGSFTAHPKLDPVTGEMFTFGYHMEPPYVTYHVVEKDGTMRPGVEISVPEPVMMHDMAITERYCIFMDLPLIFRPKGLAKGKFVYQFDEAKKSRFGILPRYDKDQSNIRWFELPTCFIFHTVNAWEEGDEVVLFACRMEKYDLAIGLGHEGLSNLVECKMFEFRFNMRTGEATQRQHAPTNCEFPRVNEGHLGRPTKYAYAGVMDLEWAGGISGVVKVDLGRKTEGGEDAVLRVARFGEGRSGGEPVFVPRTDDPDAEEDDGYLLTFVYDASKQLSEFVVLDAKTMSSTPVASVQLKRRVPYGFHGIFVSEAQLQEQRLV